MSASDITECCPRFNPDPWDEKEIEWEDKKFVKDRVKSLFHIPINFGSVMKRNAELIEAADAKPEEMIVLSDENSLWGADVYIGVTKDVPSARMATISGTFLSKVFVHCRYFELATVYLPALTREFFLLGIRPLIVRTSISFILPCLSLYL